jgi:predicted DCC family thiol-disulfide oxidoreductase YuxK
MNIAKQFPKMLYEPRPALDVAYIRILLFGFFIYKLLSRDFPVFGVIPKELLNHYPHEQYRWQAGYDFLGLPQLVDLASFHWIHWAIPLPNETTLWSIYFAAILACLLVVLFGRGPRHLFAIASYILLSYLWGFVWRSSNDIDAVFMHLQMILIYCFFREKEALTIGSKTPVLSFSAQNGWFVSMVLLVFCTYYFYAGLNKLIDISPLDWFRFDLFHQISDGYDTMKLGYFKSIMPGLTPFQDNQLLNMICVPFTYVLELTIPLMFFRRKLIPFYLFFFEVFHLLTWGVGILFLGNMIIWFSLIPIHRFFQPITVIWDGDCTFCKTWIDRCNRLNWLGLIRFVSSNEVDSLPETLKAGWNPDIVKVAMWAKGTGSPDGHQGSDAFRRMAWVMPALWPILWVLYIPPIPIVGRIVYSWVAKNRYRFGCNSGVCQLPQKT